MERKIGEIFEYNGEWYQCVEANENDNCNSCDLQGLCIRMQGKQHVGNCMNWRTDNKRAIFKKLEKVGESCEFQKRTIQTYKLYTEPFISFDMDFINTYLKGSDTIDIIIKQDKEDMEENKLNLKPFDIQKAREGKPVCTRDGKKARILCYDLKGAEYPIVAAVETRDRFAESIFGYDKNGRFDHDTENNNDLIMFPEKKEGWVNVYKRENEYICENECNVYTGIAVYKSEGEAKRNIDKDEIYVNTIKITWEE